MGRTLPMMVLANVLGTIGSIGSAVAAGAALATIVYARKTVAEARAARRESQDAHAEEIRQQAQLLETTQAAHEHELSGRQHALARELWLQRLTQLGRVQELLGETADIAREEIAVPPPKVSEQFGTWSRVTGALARVEAALVILELLEGPQLPDIKQMTVERRRMGTSPGLVVGDTMGALDKTRHLAEEHASFKSPTE